MSGLWAYITREKEVRKGVQMLPELRSTCVWIMTKENTFDLGLKGRAGFGDIEIGRILPQVDGAIGRTNGSTVYMKILDLWKAWVLPSWLFCCCLLPS